jgi:hypothetical protein
MSRLVVLAGAVGVGGAVVQLGYGVIALLWPYPTITDPPYEVLWGLVNVGMAATVMGLAVALRPRFGRLVVVGAALAVVGHLTRVVVSVLLASGAADEGAGVDGAILGSILGMFGGMGILAAATVRTRLWSGWRAWLPAATVATGLVTAAFYSIDKVAHFVMLGMLWGVPWLLLALAVRQEGSRSAPAVPSAGSAVIRADAGPLSKVAGGLSLLLGLGFGIPGVIGTIRFAEYNSVWKFMGLPTYGNGPFTDIGIPTSIPLLVGFVVVCAAEVVVGVVLWVRPRAGAWLSIALLPLELAYWIGFALPFGPVLGALRTLAVVPALRRPGVRDPAPT